MEGQAPRNGEPGGAGVGPEASNLSSSQTSDQKFKTEPKKSRDTNREMWGTWNKPYDFTLTVIGYVMGIHNFWRFPYLNYKYGAAFFIPFVIAIIFIGIPIVFMELTVGQYFSVGPTEACGRMAPVLTGVSYLLAWNAMATSILYAMMISWSRFYSSDASSCYKGWESCNEKHYYNTPECFTGEEDDRCEDISLNSSSWTQRHEERFYYKYSCIPATYFCEMFKADYSPATKICIFKNGRGKFSVYERRTNAATEHFYGGICGLQRRRDKMRKERKYDPAKPEEYGKGRELIVNDESHSGINMKLYSLTTWLLLAIFLYEGLLSVSGVTYLLNAVPFILLMVFTSKALSLSQAITGIEELFFNRDFLADMMNVEMWAEAIIQVICTMGIGTGVLITLATFNKYQHKFLFDACFTSFLNFLTSSCASLICFCTIGHYINYYRINVPFVEYLHSESTSSSIEFGYIVYTHFLTLIHNQSYAILMFFFMLTSFSTDSALRLVQMTLDTVVAIIPCLRRRRFTGLLGICALGFIALFPITQNGGIIHFLDYEYFTLAFVSPMVTFIEVTSFSWIYGAKEISKRAKEMKIVSSAFFHWYLVICLQYLAPSALLYVLLVKFVKHSRIRFNNTPSHWGSEVFFWCFTFTPVVILVGKIIQQMVRAEKPKCKNLFRPVPDDHDSRDSPVGHVSKRPSQEEQEIPPMLIKVVEKWRHNADRFNLIPNAPLRKHTPIPDDLEKGSKSAYRAKSRRMSSLTTAASTQLKPMTMQGIDDEVIAMDYARSERWKAFLLHILAYFEQWPGRFDEDSNEEESEDSHHSSSGSQR